jgi:hypothetical protein
VLRQPEGGSVNFTEQTFADAREEAAQTAWLRLRHLLHPETVHMLTLADLADAIGVAADVIAPAEKAAGERIEHLLRELDALQRENTRLRGERDDAQRAADYLAYAVATLTGEDIGAHIAGNNPWQRSLDLIDAIAVANDRPRPSDLYTAETYP